MVAMPLAAILALYTILGPYSSPGVPRSQARASQEPQARQPASPPDSWQEPSSQQTSSQEPQNPPPDAIPKPENPQPDSAGKPSAGKTPSPAGVKKRSRKHQPAAPPGSPPSGSTPSKTVVRDGSTTDPLIQISPSVSEEQASHQRQNTDQLLASTDANLKKVFGRPLNSSQQDLVNQIRNYVEQAKAASQARDVQRAHNLAFKAHLLSDELVKH
jgi:hypothetical protein